MAAAEQAGAGPGPWPGVKGLSLHPDGRRPEPHTCQLPRSYKALLPSADSESKASVLLAIQRPPVARPFNISLLRRRGGWGTSEAWSDSSAR